MSSRSRDGQWIRPLEQMVDIEYHSSSSHITQYHTHNMCGTHIQCVSDYSQHVKLNREQLVAPKLVQYVWNTHYVSNN